MNQTRRQRQPLFPSARQFAGQLALAFHQPQALEALGHRLPPAFEAVHPRHKIQVLRNAQILVKAETLGHVAHLPLDGLAFPDHVVAQAGAAARVGPEQAAQHADECGLAAAVGAQKPADFALMHLQVDMVHGREVAEVLGHPAHVDGKLVGHGSGAQFHVHRLARMQLPGCCPFEHHFDHEHQFAPALLTVDHRRGELGLR